MALINCPICGEKVSDRAAKCVHCGATLSAKGNIENNTNNKTESPREFAGSNENDFNNNSEGRKKNTLVLVAVIAVLLICVGAVLILVMGKKEKTNKDVLELNDAIKQLESSTVDNEDYINSLMEKYNALSESDKKKVKNYEVLQKKSEKMALKKAAEAAEEQKKKDEQERKRKREEEEKTKQQQEINTFLEISDYVTDADNELTRFLTILDASTSTYEDVYYCANNYSEYLSNVKNTLTNAYNLCGSYSSFGQLKRYIEKAKNSVPLSVSSPDSQAIDRFLNDLRALSTALYETEMEMSDLSYGYGN